MREDGSNFSTLLESKGFSAEAFSINQLTNVIYYFNSTAGHIIMATLDLLHTKIILKNMTRVLDLAIHEEMGYIFFSDYGKNVIGRINTDGNNVLLNDAKLWHVTGLAVDKVEGRLYFCDDKEMIIRSTDLHFKNYRIHIHMTEYNFFKKEFETLDRWSNLIAAPQSMTIRHDKLLWTDKDKNGVFQTDKRFMASIQFIAGGLGDPRDIHVYNDRENSGKSFLEYLLKCVKFYDKFT